MDRVLGVDVSDYQDPAKMDYVALKAQGFEFVIVKIGGSLWRAKHAAEHIRRAREAGFGVVIGYYWVDPTMMAQSQIDFVIALARELGVDAVALDDEQWWADWRKWDQANRGLIPRDRVPVIPGAKISAVCKAVAVGVAAAFRLLNYTAQWFVDRYSPQMVEWLDDFDQWMASYLRGAVRRVTWEQLAEIVGTVGDPYMPTGLLVTVRLKVRQFDSKLMVPGHDRLDLNVWRGDRASLYEWAGKTAEPVEDPVPADALERLWRYAERQGWQV